MIEILMRGYESMIKYDVQQCGIAGNFQVVPDYCFAFWDFLSLCGLVFIFCLIIILLKKLKLENETK